MYGCDSYLLTLRRSDGAPSATERLDGPSNLRLSRSSGGDPIVKVPPGTTTIRGHSAQSESVDGGAPKLEVQISDAKRNCAKRRMKRVNIVLPSSVILTNDLDPDRKRSPTLSDLQIRTGLSSRTDRQVRRDGC
jgi:hypothetical protein